MNTLNRKNTTNKSHLPIKVVQFGQGVFLRGFVDYALHELNKIDNFKTGVAVVKPREKGSIQNFKNQDGLYILFTKGVRDGETIQTCEVINVIQEIVNPYTEFKKFMDLARLNSLEFIFSNTTVECLGLLTSQKTSLP